MGREDAKSFAVDTLANAYALSGQPCYSIPLFEIANDIDEKRENKQGVAIGLQNLSFDQSRIGILGNAENSLRRSIDLCREIKDEFWEAVGHQELGRLLSYRGAWEEAEQEYSNSLKIAERLSHIQNQVITFSYRSLRFWLMTREKLQVGNKNLAIINIRSAIEIARRALELADEFSRQQFRVERDYIRIHWLLGMAYRANSNSDKTEENLSKAISICRQINMVDHEADILLELARLRFDQEKYEEAKSLAEEALTITERCGYVLQGADVNLFLAQYALEQEQDKAKAKEYAEEAKKLATCDGPPYCYKVAYEEAEKLLASLKV